MPEISLCMMVKNEAKNLPAFLESIKGLANEIIVVDSNSTDDTLKICEEFKARVFQFLEPFDSAKVRNFSISKATKPWILILDPDEIIAEQDKNKVRSLTNSEEYAAFYLIQRNYTNNIGVPGWKSSANDNYQESKLASGFYENPIIRLFKNNLNIKFEGHVHETVDKSAKQAGKISMTDIPIHHYGELNRGFKSQKYIKMLKEKSDETNDYFTYYQLASELAGQQSYKEAEHYLLKSLELNPNFSKSLLSLGSIKLIQKDLEQAESFLKKAESMNPNDSDIQNNLGIVFSEKQQFEKAEYHLKKAIILNNDSADAFFNLGLVYLKQNKQEKAIPLFKKAVMLNPEYKKRIEFS